MLNKLLNWTDNHIILAGIIFYTILWGSAFISMVFCIHYFISGQLF